MELLHRVAIVLITLVAWSGGATQAERREAPATPGLPDVALAPLLAVGLVLLAGTLGHWTSVAAALGGGVAAGYLVRSGQRLLGSRASGIGETGALRTEDADHDSPGWRRHLERVGNFQGRLLMHLLYFLLLGPFALVARLGDDPLRRTTPSDPPTYWRDHSSGRSSGQDLNRPY